METDLTEIGYECDGHTELAQESPVAGFMEHGDELSRS
jgi:hypothetical protein